MPMEKLSKKKTEIKVYYLNITIIVIIILIAIIHLLRNTSTQGWYLKVGGRGGGGGNDQYQLVLNTEITKHVALSYEHQLT